MTSAPNTSRRRKKHASPLELKAIEVSGFKAIKRSSKLAIGSLTLLIGRNGSGKSSVVEALQWLQESLFEGLQQATELRFHRYEDLRNHRSQSTSLHLKFSSDINYDLKVAKAAGFAARPIVIAEELSMGRTRGRHTIISTKKGSKGPAVRNVKDANPVRDGDSLALGEGPSRGAIEQVRDYLKSLVVVRLSPTSMMDSAYLERRARGALLDERGANLPALIDSLSASQREWITEHLRKIHGGIEKIQIVPTERGRGYLALSERMPKKGGSDLFDVPAWMLSEGMRRMTAVFTLLAIEPRPSLLIIEEIENGMDPWTLEYVMDELRSATDKGLQIILTTHSPFLLDHVKPEEVIHVRRVKGDTSYKPITGYSDVARYGGVVAPGAMYLSGYYSDRDDQKRRRRRR